MIRARLAIGYYKSKLTAGKRFQYDIPARHT